MVAVVVIATPRRRRGEVEGLEVGGEVEGLEGGSG